MIDVCGLDWNSSHDIQNIKSKGPFDIVLGTDVVYEIQYFDALINLLVELCSEETVFIMAMEKRWSDIEGY